MNFLAHLFLSGENTGIQAGNLFGDEIKGRDYSHLPDDVELGVTLHRFIDNHADTNEKNLKLKKSLYEVFHKYAGVALDIYFDHFLAKNWAEFSDLELNKFTNDVYLNMPEYLPYFSKSALNLFTNMEKYDWLSSYGTMDGMGKTFKGMANLLPENSGMNYAFTTLEKHYIDIEEGFFEYFPVLWEDTKQKLVDLSSINNI